jgi:anthranilate phosphoribosyltransferase
LEGETGPYHDVVLFNAAAALVAGGHAEDLQQASMQAQEALDSGKALAALNHLIAITNDTA